MDNRKAGACSRGYWLHGIDHATKNLRFGRRALFDVDRGIPACLRQLGRLRTPQCVDLSSKLQPTIAVAFRARTKSPSGCWDYDISARLPDTYDGDARHLANSAARCPAPRPRGGVAKDASLTPASPSSDAPTGYDQFVRATATIHRRTCYRSLVCGSSSSLDLGIARSMQIGRSLLPYFKQSRKVGNSGGHQAPQPLAGAFSGPPEYQTASDEGLHSGLRA